MTSFMSMRLRLWFWEGRLIFRSEIQLTAADTWGARGVLAVVRRVGESARRRRRWSRTVPAAPHPY